VAQRLRAAARSTALGRAGLEGSALIWISFLKIMNWKALFSPDPNRKLKVSPIIYLVLIGIGEAAIYVWILAEKLSAFPRLRDGCLFLAMLCIGAFGVHNVIKSKEFQKHYSGRGKKVWIGYGVLCTAMLGVFVVSSRHTESPKPHFRIMLQTAGAPFSDRAELTNSFLEYRTFNKVVMFPLGLVLIPKSSEQSDADLTFILLNDSQIIAEHSEFTVSFDAKVRCVPNSTWINTEFNIFFWGTNASGVVTNKMQSWSCRIPFALFPGNSTGLPTLRFPKAPLHKPFELSIMTRAKDSAVQSWAFKLVFFPTNLIRRPFVVLATNDGQYEHIFIPPNELQRLQK
jgi:hypothetical protein